MKAELFCNGNYPTSSNLIFFERLSSSFSKDGTISYTCNDF
jgi:hypothetical protein